jgi:hypothetical protein
VFGGDAIRELGTPGVEQFASLREARRRCPVTWPVAGFVTSDQRSLVPANGARPAQ